MIWTLSRSQGFRVGNYYKALSNRGDANFTQRVIWRVRAPPRVAFFVQTAAKGTILATDNLRKWGIIITD